MHVANQTEPTQERLQEFFAGADDRPLVMVNLLEFRDRASYPDGSEPDLTGAEAYARYGRAVAALIERHGGRVIDAGAVTGLLLGDVEDLWHQVALVEYPSSSAFSAMLLSPEYRDIARHRVAGLDGQLNIRTRAPDNQEDSRRRARPVSRAQA
jgi:uncharacterized protein (DUF1330 family)